MTLMASSKPTMTLKYFSSKLYIIRARLFKIQPLDFLCQIARPFTTRSGEIFRSLGHLPVAAVTSEAAKNLAGHLLRLLLRACAGERVAALVLPKVPLQGGES